MKAHYGPAWLVLAGLLETVLSFLHRNRRELGLPTFIQVGLCTALSHTNLVLFP